MNCDDVKKAAAALAGKAVGTKAEYAIAHPKLSGAVLDSHWTFALATKTMQLLLNSAEGLACTIDDYDVVSSGATIDNHWFGIVNKSTKAYNDLVLADGETVNDTMFTSSKLGRKRLMFEFQRDDAEMQEIAVHGSDYEGFLAADTNGSPESVPLEMRPLSWAGFYLAQPAPVDSIALQLEQLETRLGGSIVDGAFSLKWWKHFVDLGGFVWDKLDAFVKTGFTDTTVLTGIVGREAYYTGILHFMTLQALSSVPPTGFVIEIEPVPQPAGDAFAYGAGPALDTFQFELGRILFAWSTWIGEQTSTVVPKIILRFASEMNAYNWTLSSGAFVPDSSGYRIFLEDELKPGYAFSTSKNYKLAYAKLVTNVRLGAAAMGNTHPHYIAFAIVPHVRTGQKAHTEAGGRPVSVADMLKLVPDNIDMIDWVGVDFYSFGYSVFQRLQGVKNVLDAVTSKYGSTNNVGLLIPEFSYPLLRWQDWKYESSVYTTGGIVDPNKEPPKIEDFADTLDTTGSVFVATHAHDYVPAWCIRALFDGVRAILVDWVSVNKMSAPNAIIIWFNVYKIAESPSFPWHSSYAISPSWDSASLDMKVAPHVAGTPWTGDPSAYSSSNLLTYVDQVGHRPDDRLNAFRDGVTGAAWKKFLDYLNANGQNVDGCLEKLETFMKADISGL